MITHDARRSLSRGNNPVPSPWLATQSPSHPSLKACSSHGSHHVERTGHSTDRSCQGSASVPLPLIARPAALVLVAGSTTPSPCNPPRFPRPTANQSLKVVIPQHAFLGMIRNIIA
jgi:hypothetical protein